MPDLDLDLADFEATWMRPDQAASTVDEFVSDAFVCTVSPHPTGFGVL